MESLVKIDVGLKVYTYRSDGTYIARCPYLCQVSSGGSAEIAIRHLVEETEALIDWSTEQGTLPGVLQHRISLANSRAADHWSPDTREDLQEQWIQIGLPAQSLEQLTHAAIRLPESASIR